MGDEGKSKTTLWVGGLAAGTEASELEAPFKQFGQQPPSVRMMATKNCAFVSFASPEAALAAYRGTRGLTVRGAYLKVAWAHEDPRASQQQQQQQPSETPQQPFLMQPPTTTTAATMVPQGPVLAPQDAALVNLIGKTAENVARNGAAFEAEVLERTRGNAQFAFMLPVSPFYPYYRMVLGMQTQLFASQPELLQSRPPPALKPAEERELETRLSGVTKSKDSIKSAAAWIVAHSASEDKAGDVALCVTKAAAAAKAGDAETLRPLHLLYVLNEALCQTRQTRPEPHSPDALAIACEPLLDECIAAVAKALPAERERIRKLLLLWERREVYPPRFVQRWSNILDNPGATAEAKSQQQQQQSQSSEYVPGSPSDAVPKEPTPGTLASQMEENPSARPPMPYTPVNTAALAPPQQDQEQHDAAQRAVDGFFQDADADAQEAKESSRKRSRSRSRSSRSRSPKHRSSHGHSHHNSRHSHHSHHSHHHSHRHHSRSRSRSRSPKHHSHRK